MIPPAPYGQSQSDQPPAPEPQMVQVQLPVLQPVVTYAILGVTIFVYLLLYLAQPGGLLYNTFLQLSQIIQGSSLTDLLISNGYGQPDLLVMLGGKISPLIKAGQLWRLFTPALLHFSLIHIGANMYSLFALGPSLERFYGHKRFLILYILTAMGGNVLSFLMTSQGVSAGASTAIFGLVGAEGIFIYRNRKLFGARSRSMLNNVIFIVVINLGIGFTAGFDNWGHLGGLLTGLAFGWFAGPWMGLRNDLSSYSVTDRRTGNAVLTTSILIFLVLSGLAALGIFFL
jgi:rhomboid protease GluP